MTRIPALIATITALLLGTVLVACDGSSGSADETLFPEVIPLGKGDIFPYVNNTSLAVGENRVSISLIDRDDNPVLDAEMHLQFFDLNGPEPLPVSGSVARSVPVELSYMGDHIHPDGTQHSHGSELERNVTGQDVVYVASANFDRAGDWGVLIEVSHDGKEFEPIPYRFSVRERSPEPAIGDPVPASRQPTTSAVDDITTIDSSYPPNPHMHDITIADALAGGRPLVVFFGTPAFCETRTCNPVMETVMSPLYEHYRDRAAFIHVEPYDLPKLREENLREYVPTMAEWGLTTEPWLFVVGPDGRVAAKFEGVVGAMEVEEALLGVLGETASAGAP